MITLSSLRGPLGACAPLGPAPLPAYVTVVPFFKIPTKHWSKTNGWSVVTDYDVVKLFPKLKGVCETSLLVALGTQVTDHRTPAPPSSRCPAGSNERAGFCIDATGKATRIPSATGKATRIPSAVPLLGPLGADQRAGGACAPLDDRSSPWIGNARGVPSDVAGWMNKMLERPDRLEPFLVAAGYTSAQAAASAPALAMALVAKAGLLRAMWKLSYANLQTLRLARSGAYAAASLPIDIVTGSNFVKSYKGYTNPYVDTSTSGMFKPLFDGKNWLWSNITPPFPDDDAYTWALYAEYKGGSVFRLSLKRIKKPSNAIVDAAKAIGGALKTLVSYACGLVTNEKLQSVRNTAGLVPEPNTQAVVAAWEGVAAACGMVFPAQVTEACDVAVTDDDLPAIVEETFWDKHQTAIMIGALGLLAVVGAQTLRSRGKVKA